ncbi:ornithine carbamoyltransferase 1 [Haemophilus parainfluenzae]|uniref:Ornithine carbamoyltransferase 1 n=1 Tax=Haemophilus parainfluenzae TaxID=729 RepID=A0A377JHJ0_HAEPA|nr:ornithine carbamoyltransferase 1 [Haemophilus parainfluenzae]
MAFNLKNRHLLSLVHHSEREINYLLDLSRDLKRAKYAGTEQPKLQGKNIALIFEKTSTRTRCAFEVAAYDQGARVTYIDPNSSQIGHKESMKDTARVLGGCMMRLNIGALNKVLCKSLQIMLVSQCLMV